MRLEQFQYVVETAHCKSMSKASKNLFISQPSLSTAVQNLEDELGFKIFHRSPQGCTLTEKGKDVFQIAETVVRQAEAIQAMIEPHHARLKIINLAIVPAACNVLTIDLLTRLQETYPLQKLNIIEMRPHQILPAMISGAADMAVGLWPSHSHETALRQAIENDLIIEPVFEDVMYVYLSRNHPLAQEPYIVMDSLADDIPILFNEQNIEHLLGTATPPKNYYRFTEHVSIKRAVANDLGYAIMPRQLLLDDIYVSAGLIVAVPLRRKPEPLITLYLCYPAKKRLTAMEQFIADTIRRLYLDIEVRLHRK